VAEAEPAILVEAVEPPMPEADLSAIIANDPAQITAPPVKPKRGWWRLGS
jgi:ribonuclease E